MDRKKFVKGYIVYRVVKLGLILSFLPFAPSAHRYAMKFESYRFAVEKIEEIKDYYFTRKNSRLEKTLDSPEILNSSL